MMLERSLPIAGAPYRCALVVVTRCTITLPTHNARASAVIISPVSRNGLDLSLSLGITGAQPLVSAPLAADE